MYAVEVQEVRERVLPAIDAEFLKAQQADSLDTLKASVRTSLKMQKEAQNRSAQRRQITEALAGMVDFALPAALVEAETQNVLRQYIEEHMRRGVPQEQFEKDKQGLFNGAQQAAAQRVKVQLILSRIAEKEQIKVGERDIDAFIYREAMRTGQRPDKIVKDIAKDRGMLRSIQESIIFDKAVDFLVAKATVTTVQPKT
jgi:trigger factor